MCATGSPPLESESSRPRGAEAPGSDTHPPPHLPVRKTNAVSARRDCTKPRRWGARSIFSPCLSALVCPRSPPQPGFCAEASNSHRILLSHLCSLHTPRTPPRLISPTLSRPSPQRVGPAVGEHLSSSVGAHANRGYPGYPRTGIPWVPTAHTVTVGIRAAYGLPPHTERVPAGFVSTPTSK
jgi:hypothetical protein